jgi:mono/diheme cytochrome c family protein
MQEVGMNYPVWDVGFGAGLLIAIVSIVHVFVSHFAVGGGLFLVLTEKKAYREKDEDLLKWLQCHTKFFALVTVVFGAVTGVGIWFTIGLIQPSATSSLIHAYVWGWAIEWIFFFVEITAALLYLYGWKRLDRQTHLWIGWIYFIAAVLSMVIINGILTFMLTSGRWIATHNFWHGFFNPTYFPSLLVRFIFSVALAGIYALITATPQKNEALKERLIGWSGRWIIPAFVLLPLFVFWYIKAIPADVWASAAGKMPTATRYASLAMILAMVTFLGSLATVIRPRKTPRLLAGLVMLAALGTMGSFEFVREAIRKPFIVRDFMYANSILKEALPGDGGLHVATLNQQGVLATAKWAFNKEITAENKINAGKDMFRLQCQSCHTVNGYRGLQGLLTAKGWSEQGIFTMIGRLEKMVNATMPPFVGTDAERTCLAAYLATLIPAGVSATGATISGAAVYETHCSSCHVKEIKDPLFATLKLWPEPKIRYMISKLDSLNENMPAFAGTEEERNALAKWIIEFR